MVHIWKRHISLWLSFLWPESRHMATVNRRLRIVLNYVFRKKNNTRYIEAQVYWKLSKWKESRQ